LKISTNELETCEIQMVVELETDILIAAKASAARRLARKINIPGFRKGKAPYSVILQHVGDDAVTENAIEELGQQVYKEALEQTELEPFAPGNLVDVTLDDTPLLTFKVPLPPQVDMGDYKSVRVPYEPVEISDTAITESMEHLRSEHALLEPIERPAQLGDVITIDARGILDDDTEEENVLIEETNLDVLLEAESEWPMAGFAQKLEGINIDENRNFDISFSPEYDNEKLAGKKVVWNTTCTSCKSRTLPELNDGFAELVSEEYKTLLDLRIAVRKQLEESATLQQDREHRNIVVEEVLQKCTIDYPPIMLQERIQELIKEQDRQLRSRGITLEDYLKIENQTEEEYVEELKPDAIRQLCSSLMLSELVKVENIEVDADEIDTAIEKTSMPFGDEAEKIREMLQKDSGRRSLELDLLSDKALARLQNIAKGDAVAISEPDTETVNDSVTVKDPSSTEAGKEDEST
jgi:trigger factor